MTYRAEGQWSGYPAESAGPSRPVEVGIFSRRPRRRPLLSVIVVVFDMPTQAMNTLNSLSSRHQHVESHEFEVVVVENRSEHTLSAEHLADIGPNIRYLIREERGESPAAAVNVGAAIARGEYLAVMVDVVELLVSHRICQRCTRPEAAPLQDVGGQAFGRPSFGVLSTELSQPERRA